jgi:hypothetical protein
LAALGWAAITSAQARDVVLRYNYLAGESRTYGLGLSGTGTVVLAGMSAPFDFSATTAMTQTCREVADDGAMEIESISSPVSVSASLAGEPLEVGDLPTEETRMSYALYPNGKVDLVSTLGGGGGVALGVLGVAMDPYDLVKAAAGATLPEEAVSEGSQWTRKVELPLPGGKTAELTATSTLSGFKVENGLDCAVIDTQFSMPFSLEFPTLGLALEGWAAGKMQEVVTVEQLKTLSQTGDISLSFSSSAQQGQDAETLLGPGALSDIKLTLNTAFNLHLQDAGTEGGSAGSSVGTASSQDPQE